MPGLLDILSSLLGGGSATGMLNQYGTISEFPQQGVHAQNQQPQGMLNQQPQQTNFLQNVSRALIASGQPSMYKKSFGQSLLDGAHAGVTGDASPYEQQAMLNSPNPAMQKLALQRAGGTGGMPSAIQEYQYYSKLPANQQQEYLKVKRAEQFLNTGDSFRNPITGEVIQKGISPDQQPALKAAQVKAETDAKNLATNQNNLPELLASSANTLQQINEIRNHPGKSDAVGAKNLLSGAAPMAVGLPPAAGSDAASFMSRLDQLKGGQFLQAYNTLKGAGQITEIEGEKAQNAIARLQTAQKESDFDQALTDYESVIKTGMERARKKAGISINDTSPTGQTSKIGGVTSYQDYFK